MTDIVRQIRWDFDFNEGELRNLQRALNAVESEHRDLADLLTLQDRLVSGEINSLAKLQNAFSELGTDAQHELGKIITQLEKVDNTAKSVNITPKGSGGRGVNVGQVGTGLSQIGSATGIGAIQDASGIFDAIEGLGALKESLSALPATIKSVVAAIGVGGAIAGGVLIVALAGLAIAAKAVADDIAKRNKELIALAEARTEITEEIVEGLTTEKARTEIDNLQRKIEEYSETLKSNQKDYDEFIERESRNRGPLGPTYLKQLDEEERLYKNIENTKNIIEDAQGEIDAYNEIIDEGRLIVNDRTEAEKRLADEMANSQERAIKLAEEIAGGLTTEDAQKRLADLTAKIEEFTNVLNSTTGDTELIGEALKSAQTEYKELSSAIDEGRLVINDRIAAEEKLAEIQKELALASQNRAIALAGDIAGGLTSEGARDRIAKLKRLIAEYNIELKANVGNNDLIAKAIANANAELKSLEKALQAGRLRTNDQINAEKELSKTRGESVRGIRDGVIRVGKILPFSSGTRTTPTRETEPSTLLADIAKIRAGINEDLLQLRERFFNEEREALIQHEQDKARILDDFAFENQNALYDRDARASRQLQNQRDKSLKDLSQDLENTLRVLNTNLVQETAQLQRQLNQQIQERYAEETRAVNTITQAVNNLSTASARLLSVSQQSINAAVANSLAKVFG